VRLDERCGDPMPASESPNGSLTSSTKPLLL
jgi:hypothetical protein